jgi:hypothetical protein
MSIARIPTFFAVAVAAAISDFWFLIDAADCGWLVTTESEKISKAFFLFFLFENERESGISRWMNERDIAECVVFVINHMEMFVEL